LQCFHDLQFKLIFLNKPYPKCTDLKKFAFFAMFKLWCPRYNQFFSGSNRNIPKLNLFLMFFSLFCDTKKHFFRFVSVFRTGFEIKQEFLETDRKKLQKMFCNSAPSKSLIFILGSNRHKLKLNLFRSFFGLYFS
jgi:hypothetical protein